MALTLVTNHQLIQQEQAAIEAEVNRRQNEPVILGIAAYLKKCWSVAQNAKRPIERIMLENMKQRNGDYDPSTLQDISKFGGSDLFMRLTEVKCRAAEAWLRDILLDTGTPPWGIEPTPVPDLSPAQMTVVKELLAARISEMISTTGQPPTPTDTRELENLAEQELRFRLLEEAHNRCTSMKYRIQDQFAQGGWEQAFNEFITDLVTYPAAFIKGPVVRRQRKLGFATGPDGRTHTVLDEVLAPEYERVDPFHVYPEPGITNINDGYLFEHHPLTRMELADMIGVPGYDDNAIRMILQLGPGSSWINDSTEYEKNQEERKFQHYSRPTGIYDALEFWGRISGRMLREWGLTEIDDDSKEYDANVWLVGNFVIKATLNYDPLGNKPYHKTSFIKRPGAFWGSGVPEVISDIQQVCNASIRALVNNMGIASGPQVQVNLDRLPNNEPIETMHPWRIWQVCNEPLGSNSPSIRFDQPEDRADVLLGIYEKFSKFADDHSGIPAYVHGDTDVHGAGRTASGLSMLMGSAGKGIRQVIMHIDSDVTKPVVTAQYMYNMRYDPDEAIKGDAQVVAKGAVNLAVKESVNVRRMEFLQITANEIDMQIVGLNGRAAVLREIAKELGMDVDEIVPSRDQFNYEQRMMQQAPEAQKMPETPQQGSLPGGGPQTNTVSNQMTGGGA